MNPSVVVATQFRGPLESGNGGYVSGLLADYLLAPVAAEGIEVTLRAPTPLDTPMEIRVDDEQASAYVGDTLIGQALPKKLELEVPAPPSFAQALAVQRGQRGSGCQHRKHRSRRSRLSSRLFLLWCRCGSGSRVTRLCCPGAGVCGRRSGLAAKPRFSRRERVAAHRSDLGSIGLPGPVRVLRRGHSHRSAWAYDRQGAKTRERQRPDCNHRLVY